MNDEELIAQLRAAKFTDAEIEQYLAARPKPVLPPQVSDALKTVAGAGGGAVAAHPYIAGLLGGAGAVAGAEKATRSARATRRLGSLVEQSGGVQNLLDQLQGFENSGRGNLVTLGDLGDAARTQADFVATHNPVVRTGIAKIHEARQAGAPMRLKQDVVGLTPAGVGGVPSPRSEIDLSATAQSDFAKSDAGFEGLRKANPVVEDPGHLADFLKQPENQPVLEAYNKVRSKMMLAGGNGAPSFSTLHQMDRDLSKQVTSAFQSGDGDTARELKAARQRLLSEIEQQVGPKYQDVARRYRAFSQQQELLQQGLDFWNSPMQVEDVQRTVASLTPEELDVFRRGVAGGLLTKLDMATNNPANELVKSVPLTQAKLEVVFGSKATLDRFMNRVKQERAIFLGGAVPGKGSQTAARESEAAAEAAALEGGDVAHAITSPKHAAVRFIADKLLPNARVLARGTAKELEPYFLTQGAQQIRELLQALR